ncbi:PepSY domain-containing protein [Aerococcus urinaeequi]|uniref:PepSY domain-containing protein n=1 Tax=Aerococcus urinaeequi TaxID=51665 RepID=A0AA47G9Q3_9LACT|nr:PepSY domain-containing protein [Aerococcus urinaeequi]WAT24933.1 PepSY domain-containing protein [Aerococcus urinaeequi]
MKLKTGALTLFASVFLLAACGNSGQEDTTTSETAATTNQDASSSETSSETVPSSEDTSGDNADGSNESASSSEANQAASGEFISEDEAWQIALDDAGTTEDALTERKIELDDVDDDDDVAHYEIEFTVDGDREFEYDIDATTGDILNSEKDS